MPPADPTGRGAPRDPNERLTGVIRRAFAPRRALPEDATIDMRLRHLESELGEVRTRINTLFFAVLSALALELVGRVAL